jgi:hypothetical protein
MTKTTVPTYTATIYVGFKDRETGEVQSIQNARRVIQEYVDAVGLCVTVTPTEFVYTNGGEPGIAVGLINYPRFPAEPRDIEDGAIELAWRLQTYCRQYKVSVVFPDRTVMLNDPERQEVTP